MKLLDDMVSEKLTDINNTNEFNAKIYIDKIKELVPDAKVINKISKRNSNSINYCDFKTKVGTVSVYWDEHILGFEIPDIQTGGWHTDDNTSMDMYFWFVVGVLKSKIKYHKPLFLREQAWIYSDKFDAWAVVPRKNQKYIYTKFYKKFPGVK